MRACFKLVVGHFHPWKPLGQCFKVFLAARGARGCISGPIGHWCARVARSGSVRPVYPRAPRTKNLGPLILNTHKPLGHQLQWQRNLPFPGPWPKGWNLLLGAFLGGATSPSCTLLHTVDSNPEWLVMGHVGLACRPPTLPMSTSAQSVA